MDLGYFETSLNVGDIARSLAFYRTLGFEPVDGDVDIRTVTLQKGDCRLGLYQGHLDPARTQLIFWQGDNTRIAEALRARGVDFFRPPASDDGGAAFMLLDPDGHPVFVITMKVQFYNQPGHARPAEANPRTATGTGPDFGAFALSLGVRDRRASIAFYKKLGFAETGDGQDGAIMLRNADCQIGLHIDRPGPGSAELTFRPGDPTAVARHLEAKGLKLEAGEALTDPDGHTIRFWTPPDNRTAHRSG